MFSLKLSQLTMGLVPNSPQIMVSRVKIHFLKLVLLHSAQIRLNIVFIHKNVQFGTGPIQTWKRWKVFRQQICIFKFPPR